MESSCKSSHDRPGLRRTSSCTSSALSERTKSTAPTIDSDLSSSKPKHMADYVVEGDLRSSVTSVSTYATTYSSLLDNFEDAPLYPVADRVFKPCACAAIPSNTTIFADLFPSSRRLLLRHDDSTVDGNMNLRVDTVVSRRRGYPQDVTLFHLRMHDLYLRKFSLRRYCRDSGREVCHSVRKPLASNTPKGSFSRRSWSSMLAGLRPGSKGSDTSHNGDLHIRLSKSASGNGANAWLDERYRDGEEPAPVAPALADTILLEFSNYAHVELRRRGNCLFKRFEYEYWATKYQWRRDSRKSGNLRQVSYHLLNMQTSKIVAYIIADLLSPLETIEEESKSGWIPPSSMWISDLSACDKMPDVADVIIATGLVVLADECIRRGWQRESRVWWSLPLSSSFPRTKDLSGPRRFIDDVFHRRGSA